MTTALLFLKLCRSGSADAEYIDWFHVFQFAK